MLETSQDNSFTDGSRAQPITVVQREGQQYHNKYKKQLLATPNDSLNQEDD